jgi:hypothetical protein
MSDLDALVRGAAIGITLVLAAAFLRGRRSMSLTTIGLLYAAGVIGYVLWNDPARADWPRLLNATVGVLALSCPFFFWALARSIFEDDFAIRGAHWVVLATIIVAGVAQSMLPGIRFPWLPVALRTVFRLLSLGLVLHVFWLVFTGGRMDLVETRARLRLGFLVIAGTGCAVVLLTALFYAPRPGSRQSSGSAKPWRCWRSPSPSRPCCCGFTPISCRLNQQQRGRPPGLAAPRAPRRSILMPRHWNGSMP